MNTTSRQRDLFEDTTEQHAGPGYGNIPGLVYLPEFLMPEQHDALLAEIDRQPWLPDLSRRVQHYGYKYDYKARYDRPRPCVSAAPAPWAFEIADRFCADLAACVGRNAGSTSS